VRRCRDQLVCIRRAQVRAEEHDRGQVQAPVRHGGEQRREFACRAGGAQAPQRRVLGEPKLARAPGQHRIVRGGQVELAGVDLGDMGEQFGQRGAIASDDGCQVAQQDVVGQVTKRVALHG